MASAWILSGLYKRVLLVASEIHSRDLIFSHRMKDICVLFGDGAGAVVLEAANPEESMRPLFELHTDGHFANDLAFPRTYANRKQVAIQPHMNKTSVIMHSSRRLAEVVESILRENKVSLHQVDFIVPHQSNKNLLLEMSRRLDFPMSRIVINIQYVGNTSSASIPLALDDAVRSNRIKRGDLLLFVSFGAGYSWGASLWRY